jgi:hypothetical protein
MPQQLAPDLWSVALDGRGTRYFRSLTLACLYIIDPDNPLFELPTKSPGALSGGTLGAGA